jgi:transglutaminase-like putative cysteine protease
MGLVAILVGGGIASAVLGGYPNGRFAHTRTTGGSNYQVTPYVAFGARLTQGNRQRLFTVKANQPAYWRLTALDQYSSTNGGEWTLNANGNNAVRQGLSGSVPANALHQTYRIGPLDARWMPAAYDPVSVTRPDTLVVLDSHTLVSGPSTVSGLRYSVVSQVGPAITARLRLGTAAPVPKSLSRFTQLPSDIPALVRETARGVTAGRTLPYDQAAALRDYFQSGLFTYDPKVNLGDSEDDMARFLTDRHGFCVQFASTFAVMARSLGIPARVAEGFTPGTRDASGVYQVTNDEAHAWPEIYLSGIGWTDLFDPTPTTGQPGASAPSNEAPSPTTKTTQPTPTTVAPTPTVPSGSSGGSSSGGSAPAPRGPVSVSAPPSASSSGGGWSTGTWALLLVGLLAVSALTTVVVASMRKARRRARRRDASPPAEQVAGAWAEALDGLADAGVAWPASLTPLEVAGGLPEPVGPKVAPPLQSLAGRYTAARYGPAAPDPAAVDAAWRDADEVHRKLVAALRVSDRMRARLRVRGAPRQPEPAGWSGLRSRSTKD